MTHDADMSPVKPTVIDLDPDQVTVEREAGADQPKPDEPATPPPAKSSTSYRSAAFVAALAIGVVAGGWMYRDLLSSYFPSDNVKALSGRVEVLGKGHEGLATQVQALERLAGQLTSDVNSLESAAAASTTESKALADGLAATKSSLAALDAALAETRATLADVASRPPVVTGAGLPPAILPPDMAQRLTALEQDVAALKAQKSGKPDAAALMQTLSDLKAKIEAGTSYADESDSVARLLPAASGLDVLATYAASGLPAAKGLAGELAALLPGLPTPEAPVAAEDQGFWSGISDALSSVITIRDLDAVNWQQVAAKAIALADAGDLTGAIAAVDEPEGAPPPALQQWRDRAAARVALEAALASVSEAAQRVQAAGP
jgi:hypothetical protein